MTAPGPTTVSSESSATRLGAFDLGCVVVGGIVGVGIFFTPSRVAAAVDTPTQVVLAWSLGGLLAILGALTFARLAQIVPGHGGTFLYLARAFGPLPAFLYGWANWLVIQAGALAVIALVMADYLDQALFGTPTTGADLKVAIGVLAIAAFTLINMRGLRLGKRVQNTLTVAKMVAVFALVALAMLTSAGPPLADAATAAPPLQRSWLRAVAGAMLPVLFACGGWQQGSFVAGAARRPGDVPLGILGGVATVVVAYLAVNLALLDVLGLEATAQSATPAEAATRRALEPYGLGAISGRALSVMVVISALGIMNTICLAPPFVLHVMAREGLFVRALAHLDPRTGVPTLGVLVQGSWGALLLVGAHFGLRAPATATIGFLLDGLVFVDWLFYGACGMALLRLCARRQRGTSGVAALLFALGALAVTVGAVTTAPGPSLLGLCLCMLGLPFYARLRRQQQRHDARQ